MDYAAFTRALAADIRANGQATSGPMLGRPLLILHTVGARSGEEREAIINYSRDGDHYVIAGSKGGAPVHPAWYRNLVAHPEVTVEADRETFRAHARVTSGAERERLWNQHVAQLPHFAEYPAKTDRVIPVIVLERIS